MANKKQKIKIPRAGAGAHLFLFMFTALCVLFGAWAYKAKLDIVSMANGTVVPSSKIKSIQHLEGGIVKGILVQEGERVKAGQPLMILEEITTGASVDELRIRNTSLKIDIARLMAAAGETQDPRFSRALIKNHPDLVRQARKLLDGQMKKYRSELSVQKELIDQRKQDINRLETRIENTYKSLDLLEQQIAISKELLKDQLTTEYKHLDFLREETKLKSKIDDDKSALKKARAALKESQEKLRKIGYSFKEEIGEKLKEARQELRELSQRQKKFTDSFKRTTIRSPVDGIVKTLYMVTVRGVIRPGMTIMDIVPATDRLVVEAHLPIGDIGYVQPGQEVIVKLASRDALRFGKIDGKVAQISPDAITTEEGGAFYTVRIETDKDYFEREDKKYKLYPGVQVTAFIHTGKRTIVEYLLEPFLSKLGHSLQER